MTLYMAQSRCHIVHLWPDIKKAEPGRSFTGMGMFTGFIWHSMMRKYRGLPEGINYIPLLAHNWNIYEDREIPIAHRAVMLLTYDYVVVRQQDAKQMAEYCNQFVEDMREFMPKHGSHLPAIAGEFFATASPATAVVQSTGPYYETNENLWSSMVDLFEHLKLANDGVLALDQE